MPIRNSFSVLMCNFKLVRKILIFILIVMLIAASVLMVIVNPVLQGYFQRLQEDMPVSPEDFIRHPIKSLELFFNYFENYLNDNHKMVVNRFLIAAAVIILVRFFLYLPFFPVTKILHDKMTCGFDIGVTNAFVSTLRPNLLFSLVFSVGLGVVDIAMCVGAFYMTIGLFKWFKILALPISLLITVLFFSFRVTVFSQILPEYFMSVRPKNIFAAIGPGIKTAFKQFGKNYICIFVTMIVYLAAITTTFIPTVGLVPVLLIPTIMVAHSCLSLILNYTYHRHKYFTDNGVTVYNPIKIYSDPEQQ